MCVQSTPHNNKNHTDTLHRMSNVFCFETIALALLISACCERAADSKKIWVQRTSELAFASTKQLSNKSNPMNQYDIDGTVQNNNRTTIDDRLRSLAPKKKKKKSRDDEKQKQLRRRAKKRCFDKQTLVPTTISSDFFFFEDLPIVALPN
jgi:hypothetical protein